MKLSLVLIVYRSDSSIAKEASKFCEEVLKSKNIKSNRIESDFYKDEIEKYFCNQELKPNIGIVLGGDGTFLKCANALADYDIPLLSINIGGNLGFLTQEKDFLFDKSFIEILENEEYKIDFRNRLNCNIFINPNELFLTLLSNPKDNLLGTLSLLEKYNSLKRCRHLIESWGSQRLKTLENCISILIDNPSSGLSQTNKEIDDLFKELNSDAFKFQELYYLERQHMIFLDNQRCGNFIAS